ncbi:DUF3006 domain-containing protein [Paenalkalicoccus suaedae]|uniref:DUF3006 domain-containing protein n=1 Tax=Paenalkalicoccus suaedae TaxID=2592382 RepID=A0A859FIN5_9BACI|nr:DUF3006 domain-containing protein [Paenalkalicoccus suaedae]QKS72552.1 DUF3006 domain-containing protein [Paenalkalicoccus suaedae]
MKKLGVIDRIEDGQHAVILVESEQLQFNVLREDLPAGAEEGTWITFDAVDGVVSNIELDSAKTHEQTERIENKLGRIRKKSSGSKFKRR